VLARRRRGLEDESGTSQVQSSPIGVQRAKPRSGW
jgi:hypothetical protein